jgi:DNA-binding response OmpR family regulator
MITSRGGVASLEASYASGCNNYVIKPIDAGELLAKVKNCLCEWNAEEGPGQAEQPDGEL